MRKYDEIYIERQCFIHIDTSGVYRNDFGNTRAAPQFGGEYMAAIEKKYQWLHSIEEPKIILVGGSNLAFGIDSKELENILEMPVVNLGLHAGLKQHYMLEMAKAGVKADDIVIVGFEYETFYDKKSNALCVLETLEYGKQYYAYVEKANWFELVFTYFPTLGLEKLRRYAGDQEIQYYSVYAESSFNQLGDISYLREKNVQGETLPDVAINSTLVDESIINNLNEFISYVKEQGAQIYFTWPSCDEKIIVSSQNEIDSFAVFLEEQVNATFISDINEYILSNELFFDTAYHLNDKGVDIRTEKLAADIERTR